MTKNRIKKVPKRIVHFRKKVYWRNTHKNYGMGNVSLKNNTLYVKFNVVTVVLQITLKSITKPNFKISPKLLRLNKIYSQYFFIFNALHLKNVQIYFRCEIVRGLASFIFIDKFGNTLQKLQRESHNCILRLHFPNNLRHTNKKW